MSDQPLEEIREFLKDRSVLVLDASPLTRNAALKLLSEMGVPSARLGACANLGDAREELARTQASVLIIDYFLKGQCGLDLVPLAEKIFSQRSQWILLVMAGKSLDQVRSHALEVDADGVIARPFTADSFQASIRKAIQAKKTRSREQQSLEQARLACRMSRWDDAERVYRQVISTSSGSLVARAYAGLGEIEARKGNRPVARECYEEGLRNDPKDYACVHGLLDLAYESQDWDVAYECAQRIFQMHPLNPRRIPQFTEISLRTEHWEDIHFFHSVLEALEGTTQAQRHAVSAALHRFGIHHLESNQPDDAVRAFLKAASVSQNDVALLEDMVVRLIERGLRKHAKGMESRCPPDLQQCMAYRLAEFHEALLENRDTDALAQALRLIRDWNPSESAPPRASLEGLRTSGEFLYECAIRLSVKLGRRPSAIEELLQRAVSSYPESADRFESCLRPT